MQTSYIYGRVLRAKLWRYDLRGRRHRHTLWKSRTKIKEEIDVSPLLKLLPCKSEVNRNKRMSFLFLIQSDHILVSRRSHSNGYVVRHLGFLNKFFAYWRSIREVYSAIDRLHVTCFVQWVCDILVRGEINFHVSRLTGLLIVYYTESWRMTYYQGNMHWIEVLHTLAFHS